MESVNIKLCLVPLGLLLSPRVHLFQNESISEKHRDRASHSLWAFGSFYPSEPLLLMKTHSYFKSSRNKAKAEYLTQGITATPYSKQQRIVEELELLGFAVGHPLTCMIK